MRNKNFGDKYRKFKDALYSASTIGRSVVIKKFLAKQKKVKLSFLYDLKVFNKDKKKIYPIKNIRFVFNGRYNNLKRAFRDFEKKLIDKYKESNIDIIGMKHKRTKNIVFQYTDQMDIEMEHIGSLDIDGYIPAKSFQVNEGECVVDFLMYSYKEYFNHKNIKRHNIYDIINRKDTEEDGFTTINKTGVSTRQLLKVCREYKIPLRAFDSNNKDLCFFMKQRSRYIYDKKQYTIQPLYYMLKNKHLYPMTDSKIHTKRNNNTNFKNKKQPKTKNKEKLDFLYMETDDICCKDYLITQMKHLNKEASYIREAKLGRISFRINNTKYIPMTKEDALPIIEYCNQYGVEYTGQSSYASFTQQFTDIPIKSAMNTQVSTIFNNYKRGQIHQGRTREIITDNQLKNKKCVDLVKCHRNIFLDESFEWYRLTAIDIFEEFYTEEYDKEQAFYFVKTEDIDLFSGDGIYTDKIINVAKKNKIKFELKAICRPSHTSKNKFPKKIKEFLKGNDSDNVKLFKKMVINTIAGCLGTDSNKHQFLKINNDLEQVATDLYQMEQNKPDSEIICNEHNDYYIYGTESKSQILHNNRPLYLQIIEESNIKLYNLQKKVEKEGGLILFRYSDEIHYSGDYIDTDPTFSYRQSKFTDIMARDIEKPTEYNLSLLEKQIINGEMEWTKNKENDSSQYPIIIDKLLKTGGLVYGMGGTGKSHIIKHLKTAIETIGEKYYALAYTNDAALNINGKTFHATFHLKPNATGIDEGVVKNTDIPKYIIIDEVSMLNTFIYSILDQILHFHPNTLFILCGDFHQIQPIGEEELEFKDSYILKLLANQQKWFLEVNHRTDTKGGLVSMLKFMTKLGQDYKGHYIDVATLTNAIRNNTKESKNLTDMVNGWNICYNNNKDKKGRRINNILNEHHAQMPDSVVLDIPGAEFKVVVGMRVICKKISKKHPAAKNEILVVKGTWVNEETGKRSIKLVNEILPNREALFLDYEIFNEYFEFGYAITSDKSQCKTLKGKVFVHQLNKLFSNEEYHRGYVAFGRATGIENIYIVPTI